VVDLPVVQRCRSWSRDSHWQTSEGLDHAVEKVLLALSEEPPHDGTHPATYGRMCKLHELDPEDMPLQYLEVRRGRFFMTPAGRRVAAT